MSKFFHDHSSYHCVLISTELVGILNLDHALEYKESEGAILQWVTLHSILLNKLKMTDQHFVIAKFINEQEGAE